MEIVSQFKRVNEVLRFSTAHERLNAFVSSRRPAQHQRDMYGMKLLSPTSE
jgi:hypothetical protein